MSNKPSADIYPHIVVEGTISPSNLLRELVDELKRVKPSAYRWLLEEAYQTADNFENGDIEEAILDDITCDLLDTLNEIASDHDLRFGAGGPNGASFGYWETEESN